MRKRELEADTDRQKERGNKAGQIMIRKKGRVRVFRKDAKVSVC